MAVFSGLVVAVIRMHIKYLPGVSAAAVGTPIAFNPNRALADYAKRKKWRIVVERKDVIYGVNGFSFL